MENTIVLTRAAAWAAGRESVVTAGLNPAADYPAIAVRGTPAGADINGALHGRKTGYPALANGECVQVVKTSPYFSIRQ